MAATAAAAIASSFSTTMQSLHCSVRRSRTADYCFSSFKLVASSTRIITPPQNIALVSSSSLLSSAHSFKWRAVSSLAAAVAQEEAPVTAVEEEAAEAQTAAAAAEGVVEEKGGDGSDQSGEVVNTKLYFGNLPYHCDSAQLAGIVQDYASPELVEVLYDRESGKSRGFAFVTMSSIEDCYTVIENLGGREYGGRTLRVNFSDKPKPKEPLYPETEHKLFVGNLAWSASSEILTQAFKEYGNVVGARVLYDGETGRSRGYGFVSFETKEQMENAIQNLDGVDLEGRAMRISLAQGKKQ